MKLDFRIVALFTALLSFSLAAAWLIAPDLLLSSWGVEFSPAAGLVARRGAALSAGISVMFFMARNAEHSTSRAALIRGIITTCMILASFGGYSFLFVHPDGRQLEELGKLLDAGHIHPVIDKVFPFDQTKEALSYLEEGRAKGKVVVQMLKK